MTMSSWCAPACLMHECNLFRITYLLQVCFLQLGLVYLASFLFFLFSTIPKIGFATLMQTLAAQADASGRIFGFVAAFLVRLRLYSCDHECVFFHLFRASVPADGHEFNRHDGHFGGMWEFYTLC